MLRIEDLRRLFNDLTRADEVRIAAEDTIEMRTDFVVRRGLHRQTGSVVRDRDPVDAWGPVAIKRLRDDL